MKKKDHTTGAIQSLTKYKIVKNSKSELKNFSRLCTFKIVTSVSKKLLINFVSTKRKAKKKFSATLFTRPSFVALGLKVTVK
jgi:hypothetical protein